MFFRFKAYPLSNIHGAYSYIVPGVSTLCEGTYDSIVITSNENDNSVEIYRSSDGGLHEQFTIYEFETYTLHGDVAGGGGLAGWIILGKYPLTVLNGAGCVHGCSGPPSVPYSGDQAWDSVFDSAYLGTEYITFPVHDWPMPREDRGPEVVDVKLTNFHTNTDIYFPAADPSPTNFTATTPGQQW